MLEPLPLSQQMVELTAGSRGATWNGLSMVHEWCRQATGRFFWQLAAGEWNLRAVSRENFTEQRLWSKA
jgi:hypothetical protein